MMKMSKIMYQGVDWGGTGTYSITLNRGNDVNGFEYDHPSSFLDSMSESTLLLGSTSPMKSVQSVF